MLLELLRFIFGFRGTKKAEREEGAGRGDDNTIYGISISYYSKRY